MAVSTTGNGPTMFDVWGWLMAFQDNHGVVTSAVMEPLPGEQGRYLLRLIAQKLPVGPIQRLRSATGIPNVVIWECQWSTRSDLDLSSTLFRGCFELEIEVVCMLEQLGLPVD